MTANRYQISESNFIIEILDDGIPMHYSTIVNRLNEQHKTIIRFEKENEQLKQRNDRQAKQLDRLYNLIEEKDWTALSDIIDDFKRCEEQLQKEWGVYDESE